MRDPSKWTEQELIDSLNKLDEWYPPQTPSLASIQQFVLEQSKVRKRLLIRDLTLFLFISIIVISIGLYGVIQNFMIYAVLQTICLISFPVIMLIKQRKQQNKKRVESL
jgi:hypothetical protein